MGAPCHPQAMDRCHRIGQRKPVLVLRLATANSVEGKMLRRANSKLMLEKLIIKRGAFLDHSADEKPSSMKADDLLELLRPDINIGNDAPQSGVVSDKVCPHRSVPVLLFSGYKPAAVRAPAGVPGWNVGVAR